MLLFSLQCGMSGAFLSTKIPAVRAGRELESFPAFVLVRVVSVLQLFFIRRALQLGSLKLSFLQRVSKWGSVGLLVPSGKSTYQELASHELRLLYERMDVVLFTFPYTKLHFVYDRICWWTWELSCARWWSRYDLQYNWMWLKTKTKVQYCRSCSNEFG